MGKDTGRTRGEAIGAWLEERVETFMTLAIAITATFLGFLGVAKGDKLSSVILAVLVVMAAALLIERERRIRESKRLDNMAATLVRVSDDIRALSSPAPYHVVVNETVWEARENGDALTRRTKTLRFTQDEVIAITDWHRGEGDIGDLKYLVGSTPAENVHQYPSGSRDCNLIALDRVYMRDEEQDFIVERMIEGAFPKNPDRVWVVPFEPTSLVRMTMRWTDRQPTEVRLIREPPHGGAKVTKIPTRQTDDGWQEAQVEIVEPETRERLGIEWNW